jgi:NAD(P)-dependent dehydrogenase (short-subunit alcohol dehydrogenase family)
MARLPQATRNTVLITGASSGIGRETAREFARRGWNVAASMRSPEKEKDLLAVERVVLVRLDVTDRASIEQAVGEALSRFGAIDAIVNNAGYALTGPFELATPEQIERQFATNVVGLMAVTRSVLPHFRERQRGTIVNISSVGGRITFPFFSLYHSTKWAVEGFSESLQHELRSFNIRVKIVEPGIIDTDFYGRSADSAATGPTEAYASYFTNTVPKIQAIGAHGSKPTKVAEVIYEAVTDDSGHLRYSVGIDAKALLALRHLLPDSVFDSLIRGITNA